MRRVTIATGRRARTADDLRRALGRLTLFGTELVFLLVLLELYGLLAPHAVVAPGRALAHGAALARGEAALHVDVEPSVVATAAAHPGLLADAGLYYATSVFLVPLVIAVLLVARDPTGYRRMRQVFVVVTVLAFAVFWWLPVAPPCLMVSPAGCGPTPPDPFAALPSLHVAWSGVAAVGVALLTRRRWARALGAAHVVLTVLVVLVTGHHWVVDVVAGLALAGGVAGLLSERVRRAARARLRTRGAAAGAGRAASPWPP